MSKQAVLEILRQLRKIGDEMEECPIAEPVSHYQFVPNQDTCPNHFQSVVLYVWIHHSSLDSDSITANKAINP